MTDPFILLVEDDANDEALTQRVFRKMGIANPVVVARDGAEALDFIFARGEHAARRVEDLPRVILLDLNLPKIGGLEVLRQVRDDGRTRLVPVVILTSSAEESDRVEGYALGANSYVVKPVDFGQFSDAVRQVGLYWMVVNQHPLQEPSVRPVDPGTSV